MVRPHMLTVVETHRVTPSLCRAALQKEKEKKVYASKLAAETKASKFP